MKLIDKKVKKQKRNKKNSWGSDRLTSMLQRIVVLWREA